MNAPFAPAPHVEAFFFDAQPGTRFSLYHAPSPHSRPRGAILYVHPFAEELNRSRRMAALQSRAFASLGFAVLQIDLFGCGDSCGDFSAARWDIWKNDLSVALDWVRQRAPGPAMLWGLRLGALLALDYASAHPVDGLVLWQPFLHGRTCINQFLRQQLIGHESEPAGDGPQTSAALRASLAAHGSIEIAGYALARELAQAIDAVDCAALAPPPCPIHWFASAVPAPQKLAARADRLGAAWAAHGATVHFHPLAGVPFWSHGQPAVCPAMLAATASVFGEAP